MRDTYGKIGPAPFTSGNASVFVTPEKSVLRIGEVLIHQGVLTREQVADILREQKRTRRPFGLLAEQLFDVDARAVEEAWVAQYVETVGLTDLSRLHLDPACRNLVSTRQAWQFHLLPLSRASGELTIATDPPNAIRALNFATRSLGEVVHLVIASPTDLRARLMQHYPVPPELAAYSEKLAAAL